MMNFRTIKLKIRIIVEQDENGFHAYCPELKGLHVGGATEDEALRNARDAAIAYIRSLLKHDDPIPIGATESDESHSVGHLFKMFVQSIVFPRKYSEYIEELSIAA